MTDESKDIAEITRRCMLFPELLEALKEFDAGFLPLSTHFVDVNNLRARVVALIAKAEGQS